MGARRGPGRRLRNLGFDGSVVAGPGASATNTSSAMRVMLVSFRSGRGIGRADGRG